MVARSRIGLIALAAGLIALGLAGCGVRGPLQLPPEAKNAQTTASAESGQGKPEGAAPAPHQSFILDGLLR